MVLQSRYLIPLGGMIQDRREDPFRSAGHGWHRAAGAAAQLQLPRIPTPSSRVPFAGAPPISPSHWRISSLPVSSAHRLGMAGNEYSGGSAGGWGSRARLSSAASTAGPTRAALARTWASSRSLKAGST